MSEPKPPLAWVARNATTWQAQDPEGPVWEIKRNATLRIHKLFRDGAHVLPNEATLKEAKALAETHRNATPAPIAVKLELEGVGEAVNGLQEMATLLTPPPPPPVPPERRGPEARGNAPAPETSPAAPGPDADKLARSADVVALGHAFYEDATSGGTGLTYEEAGDRCGMDHAPTYSAQCADLRRARYISWDGRTKRHSKRGALMMVCAMSPAQQEEWRRFKESGATTPERLRTRKEQAAA